MLSNAGLVLIIIGWVIQLLSKSKDIKIAFVLVYALGVALLAIDGFVSGTNTVLAILNTVSCLSALAVLVKFRK